MGLLDFCIGCQLCGRFSPRLILAYRPPIFRARPNHIGSPDAPRSSIEKPADLLLRHPFKDSQVD